VCLFYEDLSGHLEEIGFEANPYDPCVMNRNIQGSQCTIVWHVVDDLKITHKSQAVVDRMLKHLSDIYLDLSITRGSKHTFVGMDLEFKNGEVKVSMPSYLHESIEAFPENIDMKVSSPTANHLNTVNPNAKRLPEDMQEIFHSIVAKLLFVPILP
jgi:Reverse transcriptase (RNA-dependent DNA polymerase).